MKHKIFFLLALGAVLLFPKKSNSRTFEVDTSSGRRTQSAPDSSFYILGTGEIEDVKIIGIQYTTVGVPMVSAENNTSLRYDSFWKYYFSHTKKYSDSISIACESMHDSSGVLGRTYSVNRPYSFLTPYLFSIGVQKVAICDNRKNMTEYVRNFWPLIGIFDRYGGEMEIKGKRDSHGLHVIKVTKEPVLGQAQLDSLRTIWYPKVHLIDKEFEDSLVSFFSTQSIPVVGAVHALHLYKADKVACIALTLSKEDFLNILELGAIEEYYLKLIGK